MHDIEKSYYIYYKSKNLKHHSYYTARLFLNSVNFKWFKIITNTTTIYSLKNIIKKIFVEIYKAKNTVKYTDSKGNLRRIEKLYDKGKTLNDLNSKILLILKRVFGEKFVIFKDKFNAKPPGGDGFYAHFDGIFKFTNKKNKQKNGWYEYTDFFVNALVALDECNKRNGSIELSNFHKGSFEDLLKKTKADGTPALNSKTLKKIKFNLINLKEGDMVFFSNRCPHQSKKIIQMIAEEFFTTLIQN